ncbi:MAG: sulfotransferase [Chloroflexota bacterium]
MTAHIPLFILGHPRSGTTALARLLNRSPQVACLYQEGNLLFRLWQTMQRTKVLEEPISDLLADFETTAQHNLVDRSPVQQAPKLRFCDKAIRQLVATYQQCLQASSDPQEIFTQVSSRFFAVFAESAQARVVGDKVPDYLFIPEHITAPHPDSLIISISRDPRAVIHSSLVFGRSGLHLFASPSAFAMAVAYCVKQKGLDDFFSHFAPKRRLCITQEELLAFPQAVQEKSHAFLQTEIPAGKGAISHQPGTKEWRKDMRKEDREAVNAVCCVFGLMEREDEIPCHWSDKAESCKQLFDSADNEIAALTRQAALCFHGSAAEKREFGYALTQLADYFHKRSSFSRARLLFQQAVNFVQDDPILWYKYGLLCYDTKQYKRALACLEQSSSHCPRTAYHVFLQAKILYLQGMVARLMGHGRKAELAFQAALRAKPDFALPAKMLEILQSPKAATL